MEIINFDEKMLKGFPKGVPLGQVNYIGCGSIKTQDKSGFGRYMQLRFIDELCEEDRKEFLSRCIFVNLED